MHLGVDITTAYYTFVYKLDINMWSLLDNILVNKWVNGGSSIILTDVVAICRD